MKIRELIATLRGSRRQPERGASQAPEQRDAVRVRGGVSFGLTAEEAEGRRQLLFIAVAVWAPLIVNTLATGLSALSVGLSFAALAVTVASCSAGRWDGISRAPYSHSGGSPPSPGRSPTRGRRSGCTS